MAVFFIRYSDQRVLPVYCHQPTGGQADAFIQAMSEKHKEALRKFLEKERPEEGECYIWVREDATLKVRYYVKLYDEKKN